MKPDVLILDCGNKLADKIAAYLKNCFDTEAAVYDSFEKIPDKQNKCILLYVLDDDWDEVYHRSTIAAINHAALADYIVVISMHGEIKTAVTFIRLGAVDYIEANEQMYEKLGDSLFRLLNILSLEENITTVDKRLTTRNRQFIASLSVIVLLIILAIWVF